jgi:hypothetical protein
MVPFLLPCATAGLASIAAWCASGTTTVVICLSAAARMLWAARAVQGDVVFLLVGHPWDAQRTAHLCATRCPI